MPIFADFAGYSLIAIGLAAMPGYELPPNFNFPFRTLFTMNSNPSATTPEAEQAPVSDVLDDLDLNEPLGERQAGACSMEEGCTFCQ